MEGAPGYQEAQPGMTVPRPPPLRPGTKSVDFSGPRSLHQASRVTVPAPCLPIALM